ncbi:ABC transporter ATP-binding protein [Paludibaculum fermentans]|uniref:ABC transporter ATP-binding protein n=1 Tax=Paludibaculum fermentans TaxID=1473598 RepID=A0A7S7NW42_PALFE|nr:ABC transporter ATP-binding protein [Paludibaculum fermentans]QOY90890.1 ABC transporter ATP-binding protein [Paludibaculum fermentans]
MSSPIHCRQVTRRFGSLTAVNDVSLDVPAGEICSILGPNGAGKSTLIRLLCGLASPDSGSISVAGFDPAQPATRLEFRRRIGVVPENLALLPELTIEEHLRLTGPIYGLDSATARARSEELLQALALSAKRHTYARECSHGMRKKTALAIALLHNPSVLMLDEPFEGVDPASVEVIRVLLETAARRGVTILLTSHILSLVDRISSRIVLLRDGRILHNEPAGAMPHSTVEELYFQLVEQPSAPELQWLGSQG